MKRVEVDEQEVEEEEKKNGVYLPPRPRRLRVTPTQRRGTDRAVREFL